MPELKSICKIIRKAFEKTGVISNKLMMKDSINCCYRGRIGIPLKQNVVSFGEKIRLNAGFNGWEKSKKDTNAKQCAQTCLTTLQNRQNDRKRNPE